MNSVAKFLNVEFRRRQVKNSAYSLRAFARSLGVDPSLLSKVLKGKRGVSKELEKICSERFNWESIDWLESQSVDDDQFQVVADWLHFSVLESLKLTDVSTLGDVAKRFGLATGTVEPVLSRLVDLGYIKFDKGQYVIVEENHSWAGKTSSWAKREYQRQLSSLSAEAIDSVDFSQRDHSSLTICASRKQVPAVREEIRRFRKRLEKIIGEGQEVPTDVYQLVIGFFPSTKEEK